MKIKNLIILMSFFTITACSTNHKVNLTSEVNSSSKADGIVNLIYSFGTFEDRNIEDKKNLDKAIKICNYWNYNSAEVSSFKISENRCHSIDYTGKCNGVVINKEFQCIN